MSIPVEPVPAPRPRVSKFGTYFPANYTAHKKALEAALPPKAQTLLGELRVEVELVCPPITKSKFTTPKGDLDNLAKPILDVLTKLGWYGDDRQIVELHITKRFPKPGEQPHINVSLLEIQ